MYNVGGLTVFGGTYPARIWAAYTKAALGDAPAVPFPLPDPRKIPPGKLITSPQLQKDSGYVYKPPSVTSPTTAKPGASTTAPTTAKTVPGTPTPTTRAPPVTAPGTPTPTTVKP
jgi:membrane peptidoglycan carboxypeptidase